MYNGILKVSAYVAQTFGGLNKVVLADKIMWFWRIKQVWELIIIVSKLLYLFNSTLSAKMSKGLGHNSYGEPAWPNDILYILLVVIYALIPSLINLLAYEPPELTS